MAPKSNISSSFGASGLAGALDVVGDLLDEGEPDSFTGDLEGGGEAGLAAPFLKAFNWARRSVVFPLAKETTGSGALACRS
jgi:hypothetical protein